LRARAAAGDHVDLNEAGASIIIRAPRQMPSCPLEDGRERRPPSEAEGESDLRAILEELEEVVVLVTLFVLGEVGEGISSFQLGTGSEGVREPDARVHQGLLQGDGATFLTSTIHPRQRAPGRG